jgi:ABC-type glycerol-3-phosphate transport system substrate-binding protein
MVRRLFALVLLAMLAACAGNPAAAEDGENRGGTMVTGGG